MKSKVLRFLNIGIEYSIYAVIFFIPISPAAISSFAGMAIFLFLIKKILLPDTTAIKSNKILFLFLMFFFIFMELSLLNSGSLVHKSLRALFIKWGRFPLLLWVILDVFQDTRRIVKAMCVFIFSAALVGLTVFSQKFFGFEFLRGRVLGSPLSPSTGPFKSQNGLAAYLTCAIPIILSLSLWRWKRIAVKSGFFLITAMLILSSFWTLSRGGWLGLISGLIFVTLVINYRRIRKTFWFLFSISYFIFVPLIGLALFFFQNRRSSYRFTLFRGAWAMIKEHPLLGKGVGTFMDYCAVYTNNPGAYYAHNCFFQIWAESGIFSLLSFLLFLGYIFYKSFKVILKIPKSVNFFLLTGLSAGLSGFLVHSFFDVHLYSFQLSFLFWVVLGLTVALISNLNQELSD